ncbi:GyrI-like domain-containing protein [Caulobacter sp.]|uniref:GyrI-like domain-containing protein n=1 Tax=Caulobacter sp. TaxID=78 RepID=UPI0016083E97
MTAPSPPRIEQRSALRLIGLVRDYALDESMLARLPQQWAALDLRIPDLVAPELVATDEITAFGVALPAPGSDRFRYMTAVPVEAGVTPPAGLELLVIPAASYLTYPHRGHVSTLHQTVSLACPGGSQTPDGISFLEYYGPGFDPKTGLGDIEVWTPIDQER